MSVCECGGHPQCPHCKAKTLEEFERTRTPDYQPSPGEAMTDEELAFIRQAIADGLGLTHGRAQRLLAALDEARFIASRLGANWFKEMLLQKAEVSCLYCYCAEGQEHAPECPISEIIRQRDDARETQAMGLRCFECGEVNIYPVGRVVQRGCDHCCCDWFCNADEAPVVTSTQPVKESSDE